MARLLIPLVFSAVLLLRPATSLAGPGRGHTTAQARWDRLSSRAGPMAVSSMGDYVIGIGDQSVFVQELWQNGNPLYLLANTRDTAVTMVTACCGEPGRVIEPPLARWEVKPHSYRFVDASALPRSGLLAFSANGTKIGWMTAPASCGREAGAITCCGLNESGGCDSDLAVRYETLEARGGRQFTLMFEIRSGTYTKVVLNKFRGRLFDGRPDPIPLPIPDLVGVTASTLPVSETDSAFVVETNHPLSEAPIHTVYATYRLPEQAVGPIACVTGGVYLARGGGYGLLRGIALKH